VLNKVREKLVRIEKDDQQQQQEQRNQEKKPLPGSGVQHQPHHHHSYHRPQHIRHFHHHRRPSRNEEPRDATVLLKWKKSKQIASRRPSTESESSDQSDAVPEIRVVKSGSGSYNEALPLSQQSSSTGTIGNTLKVTATGVGSSGHKPDVGHKTIGEPAGDSGDHPENRGNGGAAVEQPVKQRARMKLAQILYKEARRRRQKYVEELQNQQE